MVYVIESPRLRLRPLQPADLADFVVYRSDPEVCRYQNFSISGAEEGERFIAEQMHYDLRKPGKWVQVAVELRTEKRLIGDLAVQFNGHEVRIAEIGYTFNPHYQGQGYATEAVQALLKELFLKHDVHKVIAHVDERNPPSFRLLERIGFQRDGILRKNFFDDQDQQWFDEYHYALLREDFDGQF